jgi:hypothetical protein
MNERIKELAIEAGMIIGDTSNFDMAAIMPKESKFAELIVAECIDIALEQKKWVEDMKVHNPHDEVWNKARIQQSQHIVDQIEKHFGVEE